MGLPTTRSSRFMHHSFTSSRCVRVPSHYDRRHAAKPAANPVALAGLQSAKLLVKSSPGPEASRAIVRDAGTAGVRLLLIKSEMTERELSPSGVTKEAQHPISSSCGSKTYAFTQIFPNVPGIAPKDPPSAPVLEIFTTESPMLRFAA